MVGVPRVTGHGKGLVWVGQAYGELHGRCLADKDRAGSAKTADNGPVALLAPLPVKDERLRRRWCVVGREDVLDAERDALERPEVDSAGELRVGRGGSLKRSVIHPGDVAADLAIDAVGPPEQFGGEFNTGNGPGTERRGSV